MWRNLRRISFVRNRVFFAIFPGLAVRPVDGFDDPGSLAVVVDCDEMQSVQVVDGSLDCAVAVVDPLADSVIRGAAAVLFAPTDEVQDVELRGAEQLTIHRDDPVVQMGM